MFPAPCSPAAHALQARFSADMSPPSASVYRALLAYGGAAAGAEVTLFVVLIYFFKFATDVLGVSPWWVGSAFALARVWDAVSDPLVGYFSDRTQSRWGPRRPWIMAGGAALAPIAFALWAPPSMSEGAMRIWLLLATISFFTAHTAVAIPLASWGADWAAASSDRTRAYGARQIGVLLGMGIGMAFVAPLLGQERIRDEAFWLALGVAAVGPLLIVSGALFLADTRVSRARDGGFDWFRTVVSNPHARTLLSVRLAAALSSAALSVLGGHVSEHIIGDASA